MAGVFARLSTGEVSLSAATAKTALQVLAASNQRVLLHSLRVSLKGAVVTDTPINWKIVRQTGAGSGGTSLAAGTGLDKENNADDETLQMTAQKNLTSEPTSDDAILDEGMIHPQDRDMIYFVPPLPIKGGQRVGVKLNAPQSNTVIVAARVEE